MNTNRSSEQLSADSDRFVYQADPEQSLSEAVIVALARESELDDPLAVATEFGPLYAAIDPEALDSLFESSATADRSSGSVTFTYARRTIAVDTTGRVEICRLES